MTEHDVIKENTLTPAMFFSDMQVRLLANAELEVIELYCQHHCIHHRRFQPCYECPNFSVPIAGYICCSGYEPEEIVEEAQ